MIASEENPLSRLNVTGHITASGLVIKDDLVLLIYHPYIKQWFQPGGHIDDGESPIEAAIREVYEETGILCESTDGQLDPVDIDLHEIPANPKKGEGAHLHIDLLFVLQVIEERDSPEDIQKAWVPFDQITSPRIKRALQKLQDQA
ncbi:NUDIX domain-containing protein [Polynucleobacter sp. JS-Mosq-20-D10]|uniref:NUDIX hydrolase n=1 Tax=Polynucleobacter sp. JS-Mosq-20-D10 TaxID=2576922 RepID=UPI001BFD19BB|nr:NUDIX domain-containing protein [Polynucleobacter sp. JS-Mosq-20-D10]QWD99835.1 NUDIX domain-containing protein [Polynucleobacter sp. JS-Mosq-20-D10]